MTTTRPLKVVVASLAALSVLAVTGCSAQLADSTKEQLVPDSTSASVNVSKQPGRKSVSIAATANKPPKGALSDKYSQVHMQYWNNTNEVLNLVSAKRNGTPSSSAHWENQAPTSLQPGAVGTASSYAAGDASVTLVYQGADDGVQFTIYGETPNTAKNQASGQASSASYNVTAQAGTGMNPTDWFHMQPGQTFSYTGHTEQYVVPAGVTQMTVQAIGGAGGNDPNLVGPATYMPNGAEVNGTIAVSPGEVLTIGVGGNAGTEWNDAHGGWGLTNGSDNYSGGDGQEADNSNPYGGGGASVILDGNNVAAVVAGGGGGAGAAVEGSHFGDGGRGGYNGNWTGENGEGGGGTANDGGKAGGGNSGTQGDSADLAGGGAGGAGGGGANGGQKGVDGDGAGGGAGSSTATGLTGATVETAWAPSGATAINQIVLTAVPAS